MTSVTMLTGNNWSDYLIAWDVLHPYFAWETWRYGVMTGQGTNDSSWPRKNAAYTVSDPLGFNLLKVSSFSEFEGSHLAIARVQISTVIDTGGSVPMLGIALTLLAIFHRRINRSFPGR